MSPRLSLAWHGAPANIDRTTVDVMDQMEKERIKQDKQAWRKRPRQFASKSRLGCKTCKIRRVKCDLARPSCLKCQSTGRTCDGYGELQQVTGVTSSHHCADETRRADNHDYRYHSFATSTYSPKHSQAEYESEILQSLGSLMILPATGSAQKEAMHFFEHVSIKHLNEYQPCNSWRKTLMVFSQTVPAVRYAAIALAMLHRIHLDGRSAKRMHPSQSSRSVRLQDNIPMLYYTRAIELLLDLTSGDDKLGITLLVCYLFTCFDHLAGNDVQAMKHLKGGLELSRNIDNVVLIDEEKIVDQYDGVPAASFQALVWQVTKQMRRLDRQAVMFLLDWTPSDIQGPFMPRLPLSTGVFQSVDEAADYLQILITRVMELRNTGEQMYPTGTVPHAPSPSPLKDEILGQLETWFGAFCRTLHQSISDVEKVYSKTSSLIKLLHLQHATAWTFLSSHGPGREMEYDSFVAQFQHCLTLASDVATAHAQYSGTLKPTFTAEIGLLPMLYIIGAKCRHPEVRREAVSILRRQHIQEAVWDSMCTAKVLERVIEIEEGALEEAAVAQNLGRIPMLQRIEALSWVHVDGGYSTARLDVTYTLCASEGLYHETIRM